MQNHKFPGKQIYIFSLLILFSGCFTSNAPKYWLPRIDQVQQNALGAWIELRERDPMRDQQIEGEFLSVENNSVYVLTMSGMRAIYIPSIDDAKIFLWDYHSGNAIWTLLGTLSTLTHGFWLLITAPVWIITGSIVSINESRAPTYSYPQYHWDELKQYARFPQGLPKQLDRSAMKFIYSPRLQSTLPSQ